MNPMITIPTNQYNPDNLIPDIEYLQVDENNLCQFDEIFTPVNNPNNPIISNDQNK